MNRGYFCVSEELMKESYWPSIEDEIKSFFTEIERKRRAFGIIEFHGESDCFPIKPIEGATQQYDLFFTMDKEGNPKLTEINIVNAHSK